MYTYYILYYDYEKKQWFSFSKEKLDDWKFNATGHIYLKRTNRPVTGEEEMEKSNFFSVGKVRMQKMPPGTKLPPSAIKPKVVTIRMKPTQEYPTIMVGLQVKLFDKVGSDKSSWKKRKFKAVNNVYYIVHFTKEAEKEYGRIGRHNF